MGEWENRNRVASAQVAFMCSSFPERLLSNPVIEDVVSVHVLEGAAPAERAGDEGKGDKDKAAAGKGGRGKGAASEGVASEGESR